VQFTEEFGSLDVERVFIPDPNFAVACDEAEQ